MHLTAKDAKDVHKAAEAVLGMIDWGYTEEGVDFWNDIHERILRIEANINLHLKPKAPGKL